MLKMRQEIIDKLRALRPSLEKRGVRHIELFGSVARDEAGEDSDVDLIVELAAPLGFEFFKLEQDISQLLGRPVELATRKGMRPRVLEQAEQDIVRIF